MAYEAEEVKISQEIFCTLISKHELREEDNKELFEGYTQNPRIMNLVKSQGEIADCTVERYGSGNSPEAGNRVCEGRRKV